MSLYIDVMYSTVAWENDPLIKATMDMQGSHYLTLVAWENDPLPIHGIAVNISDLLGFPMMLHCTKSSLMTITVTIYSINQQVENQSQCVYNGKDKHYSNYKYVLLDNSLLN